MSEKTDIERVGDKLIKLVTDKQFGLLFDHVYLDVGCPPRPFQWADCHKHNTHPGSEWCLTCWQEYTKAQAMLDLGLVTIMDAKDDD